MKNIVILGATGSIGKNSLEVAKHLGFNILGISCNNNVEIINEQIKKYNPKYVCVVNKDKAKSVKNNVKLLTGIDGLCELVSYKEVDIVLNAICGSIGIYPTIEAIKNRKKICMANKETFVCYGELLMKEVKKYEIEFLLVDSEHVAIHQCIGQRNNEVKRIILTASGGPFLNKNINNPNVEEVLKHPTWKMGKKITVDSATLMNKGLEFIEARWFFNQLPENIKIVIHPQSIIHSAVEFVDGSVLAQISLPDMKLPIQYTLTYPKKMPSLVKFINLEEIGKIEFYPPDIEKFSSLKLAYEAAKLGGSMPCVLSCANEIAVEYFLQKKIKFNDIIKVVEHIMKTYPLKKVDSIEEMIKIDNLIKEKTKNVINNYYSNNNS